MVGHRKLLRGHYNPTNWLRKYPNLQKTRNAAGKRILACAQCLRTMSKDARKKATLVPAVKKAVEVKV